MAERHNQKPQWIEIDKAAEYCRLSLQDYIHLSKNGVLPSPFQPGLNLIDMAALDQALDRLGCGLVTEPLQLIILEESKSPIAKQGSQGWRQILREHLYFLLLGFIGILVITLFWLFQFFPG